MSVSSPQEFIDRILQSRYRLDRYLGGRLSRCTFLAIDLATEQSIVIKLLCFDRDFQWDDLKLFEREAQTLQALDLPTIPKYRDYFEFTLLDIRGFALVQDYIDAPSLVNAIESGRHFTQQELEEIAVVMLEILIHLHSRSPLIIHRDIKPSNILLDNRSGNSVGNLYLVDFGSVQTAARGETDTITVVGTYGYMPIEQFGGRTVPASDLYSLGATLIYLITGIHPANLPQSEGRLQFESTQLSKHFRRWLNRLIEPNLDRRFISAEEALTALINSQTPQEFTPNYQQPVDSQLKLNRHNDRLSIITKKSIYFSRINNVMVASIIIALSSSTISKILVEFYNSYPGYRLNIGFTGIEYLSFIFAIISFATFVILICQIALKFSHKYFAEYSIEIDETSIQDRFRLFSSADVLRSNLRTSIFGIIIYQHLDPFDKANNSRSKTIPTLIIKAGLEDYKIEVSSEEELQWLAAELSDFLGVGVQSLLA